MPKKIFISHAGPDSTIALDITVKLEAEGFAIEIDRESLRTGDSFLAFMENALSTCDYCLLLWSEAASEGRYVQVEWEAALYKSIENSRRFLLIGRLQDYPVPALLGPRLHVELFPDSGPGLAELVALLNEDAVAERASGRRVGLGAERALEDETGSEIYVTSELFGITLPVRWDLDKPCAFHIERFTQSQRLPRQVDYESTIGVRCAYNLVLDDKMLARTQSLADQGVKEHSVLWLEVELQPFAAGQPVAGELTSARYRGVDALADTRKQLLDAINRAGLGI